MKDALSVVAVRVVSMVGWKVVVMVERLVVP